MNELQTKQAAVLLDTVKHFNAGNRSVTHDLDSPGCVYYHPEHGGCAIGRLIPDAELRKRLDAFAIGENQAATGVQCPYIWELIPAEVQALGGLFLDRLQRLHDCAEAWTYTGLSTEGVRKVQAISLDFDLPVIIPPELMPKEPGL